jgi:quercetin dioxygenase-like cupin family protein
MKPRIALTTVIMLLLLVLPYNSAFGQPLPPGPTRVYESTIAVANPPAQGDLVQTVLDFAPGAWTPPHTHGGQTFNLVLVGEITLRENNTEQIFKPGEGWSDTPDQVHAAGNAGAAPARLLVTFLLPKEAPLTTVQQGESSQQPPPGPTKVYESRVALANPPTQADLIQVLLDFAPGAWTPPHTHGGQTLNTVLEGEITLRENNTEKIFKPGEGWSDTPDQVHAAGNAGAAKGSLAVAFLLPKGQQLTTVQAAAPAAAPAALPQTGAVDPQALLRWLVLAAIIGVIVGGWLIWRWRRQHG